MASMGSFDYLWGPMLLQVYIYMNCFGLWDGSMASMGSFDYLWGFMLLQIYTYMICLDLWDCSVASMGDYKSLIGVYGEIYVLLWGCGLRPM